MYYNYIPENYKTLGAIDRKRLDAYRNAMQQFAPKELDRVEVHYSTYKKLKSAKPQNIWTVYQSYNATTKRVTIKYTEDVAEMVIAAAKAEEKWNTAIAGQISLFD